MSRKKPTVNLPPEQSNNHSYPLDDPQLSPSHEEATRWRRLVARVKLIRSLTEDESAQMGTPTSELDKPKRPNLEHFKKLLAKLPWRKKSSIDPIEVQREILTEIGFELYHTRREQGLSLEAIAADTCISVGLLQAIETGNLEELPEPIYIRGMLKKFADYLGLDSLALADRFPTDVVLKSTRSPRFQIWLPTIQLRPLHLYFLYIIIVILSVQGISNSLKRAALEMGTHEFHDHSYPSSSLERKREGQ